MASTRSRVARFFADERGATAVEYALVCGIMAVAIFSVAATGGAVDRIYDVMMAVVVALGDAVSG